MAMKRLLRRGSAGEDVLLLKKRLFELCCYEPRITQITTSVFGKDTQSAVMAFQANNGLIVDGIVGNATYAALFPEELESAQAPEGFPQQLNADAAANILEALSNVNVTRQAIVLDALQFASDPGLPRDYPQSLYIRGGNLYNADLLPNVITLARIRSGTERQPEYYDGGRQQMMERAVAENPSITGADCSGGVVGLLRHAGVVKPTFDLAANGFAQQKGMQRVEQTQLLPADLLHKSGHIGLYAGGGYAVEWMGGAYGCQLTMLNDRRGWNYVKGKMDRFSAWTALLHTSWY